MTWASSEIDSLEVHHNAVEIEVGFDEILSLLAIHRRNRDVVPLR